MSDIKLTEEEIHYIEERRRLNERFKGRKPIKGSAADMEFGLIEGKELEDYCKEDVEKVMKINDYYNKNKFKDKCEDLSPLKMNNEMNGKLEDLHEEMRDLNINAVRVPKGIMDLINNQKDLEPEIANIVSEKFWELLEGYATIPEFLKIDDKEIDINKVKPLECKTFFEESKVPKCPVCKKDILGGERIIVLNNDILSHRDCVEKIIRIFGINEDYYQDVIKNEQNYKDFLKNKSEEILNKLKEEGNLEVIDREATAKINPEINKEMKEIHTSGYLKVEEPDYYIKVGIKDGKVCNIDWQEMVVKFPDINHKVWTTDFLDKARMILRKDEEK